MSEEQPEAQAHFASEPLEIEAQLMWWIGLGQSPALAGFFSHPDIDGEIREVRITKVGDEGAYTLQIGFIPAVKV
jgi:hypothetical protein